MIQGTNNIPCLMSALERQAKAMSLIDFRIVVRQADYLCKNERIFSTTAITYVRSLLPLTLICHYDCHEDMQRTFPNQVITRQIVLFSLNYNHFLLAPSFLLSDILLEHPIPHHQ